MLDNAPNCYIDYSNIQGFGLFAGRDFEKGELVLDYSINCDRYRICLFSDLTKEQLDNEKFIGISEKLCITTSEESKFSYVNHSRTPSCVCDYQTFEITAAREIQKGEEITIDYRKEPRPIFVEKVWF